MKRAGNWKHRTRYARDEAVKPPTLRVGGSSDFWLLVSGF
jgi:hypothetical protein